MNRCVTLYNIGSENFKSKLQQVNLNTVGAALWDHFGTETN